MDSSGLPSLLVEAAKTAAEEDGVACKEEPQVEVPDAKPSDEAEKTEDKEDEDADSANAVSTDASTSKKRPNEETKKGSAAPPPLRRGKWTPEEEAYAARLIVEFKAGLLPLTDGTTLRTFLSKLLNCDPMRISKKFVGSNCIGKQVFRRKSADVSNLTPDQIARTRRELSELEERFLDRVTKGGGSKKGDKYERAEKKMKMSNLASGSSAAAAGHALLGGGGSAAAAGNAGLLAQLQASQPGMFNANDTKLFNSTAAAGLNIPGMGAPAGSALDINALMLQTGMTPDQIAQLAQSNGYSSASLAATAMLDKKRSFDRLMSLDFKSMQSIDNLANLIRANSGLPSQASMGQGGQSQMKNWDWNSGAQVGMQNTQGGLGVAFGNLSSNIGPGMSALGLGPQSNSAFGMLGNYNQNSLLQNPQAQQQGQLPQQVSQLSQLQTSGQGARSGGGNSFESLLQQAQNGTASTGNSVFPTGLMGIPGSLPQHHLMGMGFNNSMSGFAGLPQAGNPMMAALAAQQQMMNQNMLPQQTQFNGLGGLAGGLGGGINLSDPKTAALVQQLLAQQGGGTSAGIASLGAATPAQAGVARAPPAAPQANEQQGPSDDAGHTATV